MTKIQSLALSAVLLLGTSPLHAATSKMAASTTGRPAAASSYAVGHPPGSADVQSSTQMTSWVASTSSFPQWLVIDLGAIYQLNSVRQIFAKVDVWSYKIEASNDNYDDDAWWTTLADNTSGVPGQSFTSTVTGSFRYLRLYVTGSKTNPASSIGLTVNGTLTSQSSASVPKPQPATTGNYLVGAQACDLWTNKMDWETLNGYADRLSIMGSYNEAYDVATDWQIKMAVEHGISFLQPCWYRLAGNEGASTVMASYDQLLQSVSNTATYRNLIKFSIDWINDGANLGGSSGVADFVNNLVPYWISTYFSKSNYLKVNGKPVLAIYDFETFISEMGGLANAQSAIKSFRSAVSKAGYPGLILETQESGSTTPANHWVASNDPRGVDVKFGNYYTKDYAHTNADAAAAGFDVAFAYHLPSFTDLMVSQTPTDTQVAGEQKQAWSNWLQYSALPTIVTASMGWNAAPWAENNISWTLTPADYQALLVSAKSAMSARGSGMPTTMILLDNWNEYGEGHYIAPTKGTAYGYLDAVGAVFVPKWPVAALSTIDIAPNVSAIPQVLNASGKPN